MDVVLLGYKVVRTCRYIKKSEAEDLSPEDGGSISPLNTGVYIYVQVNTAL